jgi:hypothetical protein
MVTTTQAFIRRTFAAEIAELEVEVHRVIALKGPPAPIRADLVDRLGRIKTKAAMLCN